jgi:Ca-activated chloride channel family protein
MTLDVMEKLTAGIARGLETQYLIGYRSTNSATDGKWRRMRIQLDSPPGAPKLTVWTRSGYYADKIKPGQSVNVN